MSGLRYFTEVVLPSISVSDKGSYTLMEVAEILGKGDRTIRRLLDRGELTTVGKRIYKVELLKYIEREIFAYSNTVKSISEGESKEPEVAEVIRVFGKDNPRTKKANKKHIHIIRRYLEGSTVVAIGGRMYRIKLLRYTKKQIIGPRLVQSIAQRA